jgi:outer membrane protein
MIVRLLTTLALLAAFSAGHAAAPRRLTLQEAHEIALRKHPKITVAELLALAGTQVANQARSAYFPNISGVVAGVAADHEGARAMSTSLPVSAIVDRGGAAVNVSQLITDFGRTANLHASAKLRAKSQEENIEATRAAVLLEVDNAYISALRAQALLGVAKSTVQVRTLLLKQVKALFANELRSSLDLSFAEVNEQEAELLLSRTENELASAYTSLATLLDEPQVTSYELVDQTQLPPVTGDISGLVAEAYQNRPDLQKLRLELQSLQRFTKAEIAARFPTVSAQATAGGFAYHDDDTNREYTAAGLIVSVPIFSGGLYVARQKEAELKAKAAEGVLHDATNNVARDVRIAWLALNTAYRNLAITSELRQQAKKGADLAQARYDAGTSGMVELTQAQLALTSAQINEASARYEYLLRRAILSFQTGTLK